VAAADGEAQEALVVWERREAVGPRPDVERDGALGKQPEGVRAPAFY